MSFMDEVRAAHEDAAPGPWEHGHIDGDTWVDSIPANDPTNRVEVARIHNPDDADLIALAPDMAAALMRIEALAERLAAQPTVGQVGHDRGLADAAHSIAYAIHQILSNNIQEEPTDD